MRRFVALVLAYGVLATCALATASLISVKADLSFVFPRDAAPDVALLAERLEEGPAAGLILLELSGASPETLVTTSNDLAEALLESGQFRFVANGRIRPPGPELQALFDKRYLMNPPVSDAEFTGQSLREALQATLESLGTAYGTASKDLLPRDPTGRLNAVLSYWGDGTVTGRPTGTWLSPDQDAALLMLRSAIPAYDLTAQNALLESIQQSFDELRGETDIGLAATGPSVFATRASGLIRAEVTLLTMTTSALVIVLLFAALRSPILVLSLVLPIGFGFCAAALAVQILFGEVHGITLAFGGTLIGIAIDYPIHVISHKTKPAGTRQAIAEVWGTLRLGLLTTVAAFCPMLLSSFPGLAQLGAFAICGLIVAALITRWLLPAILPEQPTPAPARFWSAIRPVEGLSPRVAVLVLAIIGAGFLVTRGAALWESDLRNLTPTTKADRDLDRRLRAEIGAPDVRYLLILRQTSLEQVLEQSEALLPGLERLMAAGQVAHVDFGARYLPSQRLQEQNRAALPDAKALEAAIDEASEGLPFRTGLFAPFVEDVARSKDGAALTLENYRDAGLAWMLDELLFEHEGGWVGLLVPQGVEDPKALAEFAARHADQGLSFLDMKRESETVVNGYRQEAFAWLAVGAAIGLVLLSIGLRSVARVSRVVLPVVVSIVFTLATLSLLGTAFSLFHLLSLLLVAGIGLDYALFFDRFGGQSDSGLRTLRANALCAATTVTVFAVLAFSQIPVLHGIGTTVAVGAAFSLMFGFLFARRTEPVER